jgi:hypothetical protein
MRRMKLTFIFACKISDKCIQSFTLIVVVDSYGCYTICYMPYTYNIGKHNNLVLQRRQVFYHLFFLILNSHIQWC